MSENRNEAIERLDRLEPALTVLEAGARLYHAHVENLIERVFELENTVEALTVRLAAVERATPLKRPRKPPPSGPVR